jgi:hypothetical protein
MIFSALMNKEIVSSREGAPTARILAFETFDFWASGIALAHSLVTTKI